MARTKVQSELIATNAISGTIIADGAITSTHLAANCVDSSELVTGSIDTIHIAANQVTATKIVTNGVLTRHISDDQVTAAKLANSINTDIATGVTANTTANAALPKAGGTMTGSLGVGDTAVSSIVGLFSTSTANHIAGQFVNSNASDSFGIVVKAGNDANDYTADFRDKANNNLMRIRGDGNVGIGTSSPQETLHLFNSAQTWNQYANIRMSTESDSYAAEIGFHRGTSDDSDRGLFLSGDGTNKHVRILHGGNVGIGVTDPDTNLEVNIQGSADGNGIHITSTATNNDPTLKLSRNGGSADVYSLRPRGATGSSNYLAIAPGSTLDGGINMKQNGYVGLGGNNAPVSLLHMYGDNTADVASNGAGINGLHLSRTSSKGENIYAYMTDGNAAASSWAGLGNVGKIESFGNNAFEIGTQQDAPVVIGQNNTQKLRIKGDITAHAKFGATYVEALLTPNGGASAINTRIFEDHLGKWVAVGYFAANAATSIQGTWSSVTGMSTNIGQSETTAFSADWGDSYPTEVRYLGASDFKNFNETKTIDFIHGVPVGRPWKNFFNNAQRRPDAATPHSGTTHMGSVQGAVGTEKYGWECRGAYDGRGRWHNPSYTHHKMSDVNASTHLSCPTAAFITATSNAFNWNTYSDAKSPVNPLVADTSPFLS